ncbi:MAG: hypothetical protein EAZ81_10260 [Verrucomicrobia bacterium]|nr:MAG: hypothetical protein EAZ81_10260 [Verrucomicrobiota bacterium]
MQISITQGDYFSHLQAPQSQASHLQDLHLPQAHFSQAHLLQSQHAVFIDVVSEQETQAKLAQRMVRRSVFIRVYRKKKFRFPGKTFRPT